MLSLIPTLQNLCSSMVMLLSSLHPGKSFAARFYDDYHLFCLPFRHCCYHFERNGKCLRNNNQINTPIVTWFFISNFFLRSLWHNTKIMNVMPFSKIFLETIPFVVVFFSQWVWMIGKTVERSCMQWNRYFSILIPFICLQLSRFSMSQNYLCIVRKRKKKHIKNVVISLYEMRSPRCNQL